VAETVCFLWELSRQDAEGILREEASARGYFERVIVGQLAQTTESRILELDLFRGFEQPFLEMLLAQTECRVYFPGETLALEGQIGEGLYIIDVGQAVLEKDGFFIKTCAHGGHFGAAAMLGLGDCSPCSLVAKTPCHAIVVSSRAFRAAQKSHPSTEQIQALWRSQELLSAQLEVAAQRASLAGRALRSCGTAARFRRETLVARAGDMLKHWWLLRQSAVLERVVRCWRAHAARIAKANRERGRRAWDVYARAAAPPSSAGSGAPREQPAASAASQVPWPWTEQESSSVGGPIGHGAVAKQELISPDNPYCEGLMRHLRSPAPRDVRRQKVLEHPGGVMAKMRPLLPSPAQTPRPRIYMLSIYQYSLYVIL